MRRTKVATVFGIVVAVAMLAASIGVIGCSPTAQQPSSQTQQNAEMETTSVYQEWIAEYPDQYESYNVDKWESNRSHGHTWIADAPTVASNASCLACKSSSYDTLYEEYGESAFEMDWDELKSTVEVAWDCMLCHSDKDTLELRPSSSYFKELVGDDLSDLDEKTLLCVQCHNSLSTYRVPIATAEAAVSDFRPYRNGTSADGYYEAMMEDGARVALEEETGAMLTNIADGTIVEMFRGSAHQSTGLSCVDCHMRSTENAEGEEFTSHNASGNPLVDEGTLEFCLTCHESKGVASTEEMVELVTERKAEYVDGRNVYKDKLYQLKKLLTEATESGSVDEAVLEEARGMYSKAIFIDQLGSGVVEDGARVVHNTEGVMQYLSRSEKLIDEGIALLSA